jgi:hypothetical protein
MTADGPRSWLKMLESGAVVTTEAWLSDNKPNMSWAHPWGAGPANVIVRHLFGLRPTAPGWSRYTFDPRPGGIEHGRLSLTLPRGVLTAGFELQPDGTYRSEVGPRFKDNATHERAPHGRGAHLQFSR